MKSDSARYLELVERRLALLTALLRALGDWRRAYIALDVQTADRNVEQEQALCGNLLTLDAELTSLQAKNMERAGLRARSGEFVWPYTPGDDANVDKSIRAALEQMRELHLHLKRSNDVNQAILRRSRYTLDALGNLFNSYAPTYAAPAAPAVGTIYEERA